MLFRVSLIVALAGIAVPALAQVAPAAESAEDLDAVICVGGPRWFPSAEEISRIVEDPIPAGFRARLTRPCSTIRALGGDLLAWHGAFGTEASIAAAFAFAEGRALADLPAPGAYASALRQAWSAALPDLRRALQVTHPEGLDNAARHLFLASRPRARTLRRLLDVRDTYIWLAEAYLRAAEQFGSMPLQAKAAEYIDALGESGRFAAPLENQPPAHGLLNFNLDLHRADDLRMRTAILRAELSRSPEDVASATEIVRALEQPAYYRAAVVAYSGGEDFCDISPGWGNAEAVAAGCREDDFGYRVIAYWLNRAALDLIADRGPETDASTEPHSRRGFDLAIELLTKLRASACPGCGNRNVDHEARRVYLLRADFYARALAADRRGQHEREEHWRSALEYSQYAERLTPSHEMPARFRPIADAWLALWAQRGDIIEGDDDGSPPRFPPQQYRYAVYLRSLLASLPMIALGDTQ